MPKVTKTSASVNAGAEPKVRPPPELLDILSFCAPFCYIVILTNVFYFVKGKAPTCAGAISNSLIYCDTIEQMELEEKLYGLYLFDATHGIVIIGTFICLCI